MHNVDRLCKQLPGLWEFELRDYDSRKQYSNKQLFQRNLVSKGASFYTFTAAGS